MQRQPGDVLRTIAALGGGDWSARCYRFHIALRQFYPEAKPYHDGDHVISKIGTSYYDKTGRVRDTRGYVPLDVRAEKPHRWGI